MSNSGQTPLAWADALFETLESAGVTQVAYVPDAGHTRLIERCHQAAGIHCVSLTTEEEGVAMLAGAWLGGARGALLMQSSGVGNCVNMLAMLQECRFPLLTLVTMRGEWGEANPWQVPMGQSTAEVLRTAGVIVHRIDHPDEASETLVSATRFAFEASRMVAVLIAQRVIGSKEFKSGGG